MIFVTLLTLFTIWSLIDLSTVHVKVKKGDHWPNPLVVFLLMVKVGFFGNKYLMVRFGESCASYPDYDDDPDDYDGYWNKLFGRTKGFLNGPRSHSVRWMWRRSVLGAHIQYNEIVEEDKKFSPLWYNRVVRPGELVEVWVRGIGWPLVSYFGGIYPAPQDIDFTVR